MNRRSFFGLPVAIPSIIAAAASYAGTSRITRVSVEAGDPGEFAAAAARADGKDVKVFLDGVEQRYCVTADSAEGWVKRFKLSPGGNLCHNDEEFLSEVVHGHVEIRFVENEAVSRYRAHAIAAGEVRQISRV